MEVFLNGLQYKGYFITKQADLRLCFFLKFAEFYNIIVDYTKMAEIWDLKIGFFSLVFTEILTKIEAMEHFIKWHFNASKNIDDRGPLRRFGQNKII